MAGDDLEEQGGILDRGGERPDLVQAGREGDEAVAGHQAVGGLDPDHPAQGGRLADGAAGVGAEGQGGEPGGNGGGAATAGPSGHPAEIVGVAGGTKGGVLGAAAHGELVEVGLADDHRPGCPQALDDRGVVGRQPAGQDAGRARGGDAAGAQVVLEGHGHAGQRPRVLAPSGGDVDGVGGGAGGIGRHLVEGVQLAVARGDPG